MFYRLPLTYRKKQMKTYLILNHNNKMLYIGQTSQTVNERLHHHLTRDKSKYNKQFAAHIKRGHKFTIRQIKGSEKDLIEKYNAVKSKRFYNIANGGIGGNLGPKVNKKISLSNKGRKMSDENRLKLIKRLTGKTHHFYGKSLTDEHRNKIRNSSKNIYKGHLDGENQPTSKLTNKQVINIYLDKREKLSSIARDYLVHKSTIYKIKTGKTWTHVTNKLK